MGIVNRVRYWIGRLFCEYDERRFAADIDVLKQHGIDCDRRFAALEERFERVNADRLALLQQITGTRTDDPNVWLLRRRG